MLSADETCYLFSCPDIFQRIASAQKIKFRSIKYFFLPSLGPNSFSGFMGFYLSSREGIVDLESWPICVLGPRGLKELFRKFKPLTDFFTNVQLIEFPENLEQPVIEEEINTERPNIASL